MQTLVLARVSEGLHDKEIAGELGLSVSGAKKHVERLRRRYGVDSRAALARAAMEAGDLELRSDSGPGQDSAPVGSDGSRESGEGTDE